METIKFNGNYIKAAAKAVKKDGILSGIHIKAGNGEVLLESTDSYVAFRVQTPCEGNAVLDVVVDAKSLASAVTTRHQFIIGMDGETVKFTGNLGGTFHSASCLDGNYPNIAKLFDIAIKTEADATSCFDPKLLKKACDCMTTAGFSKFKFTLHGDRAAYGHNIGSCSASADFIIMPVKSW